jgi:tRNA1Val (adenine37-N6)-methyltransferase
LEERIEIVQGDIKAASTLFAPQSKDVIVTNPPYMMDHHGLKNPTDEKAIARHEILCNLEDIVRESAKLLKESRGRFYMIHKPFRLAEILYVMCQYKIEPKRIQFIHPYIDKEPTMVMIEGLKGGKSRVKIEPPIIMYQRNS